MNEKPSRNEDEYFVRQEAELLKAQRDREAAERSAAERKTHFMKCPKCGHDLATRSVQGVAIDTCTHCGGMWLDAGELEALSKHDDRPGILGRVFGDVMESLRGSRHGKGENVRHEPGNPLA